MIQRKFIPTVAGSALLMPGLIFFAGVVLSTYLRVPAISQVFDGFVTAVLVPLNPLSVVLNALIVLGPLAAFGLNVVSFARQHVKIRTDGALLVITITRESLFPLVLIVTGLALFGLFGLYLLAENWQCLIGARASC